jgi:NAD(P)-dependent dehydrogenase (short-subunit alcohol dehydrogenase family)
MNVKSEHQGSAWLILNLGSGIGRAVALACVTYGCVSVAIADINQHRVQETSRQLRNISQNVQIVELLVDVSNEDSVGNMVVDAMEKLDRLDYGKFLQTIFG